MTRDRLATLTASVGAALVFGTAWFHLGAYSSVVSGFPAEHQAMAGAMWVYGGVGLVLAGLLAIAATPLFLVRRRAILAVAALTPLAIALLQVIYLGFLPATALLLVDGAILLLAGQLGLRSQPRPPAGGGAAGWTG